MKFSKISVKYALNNILAHSIVIDGKRLNKGKILNNKDILHLKKNKIVKHQSMAIINYKSPPDKIIPNPRGTKSWLLVP